MSILTASQNVSLITNSFLEKNSSKDEEKIEIITKIQEEMNKYNDLQKENEEIDKMQLEAEQEAKELLEAEELANEAHKKHTNVTAEQKETVNKYRKGIIFNSRNPKRRIKFSPEALVTCLLKNERDKIRRETYGTKIASLPFYKILPQVKFNYINKRKCEEEFEKQSDENKKKCYSKYADEFDKLYENQQNKDDERLKSARIFYESEVRSNPDDRHWTK